MSGQGKYTVYAPPASAKNDLLNKLFKSDNAVQASPVQDLVGKELEARAAIIALAKVALQPAHQAGDPGHFPNGVDLDYTGASAAVQPPDIAEGVDVKWVNPGDPATSYFPDTSSPGPGKTDGKDKDTDPEIKVVDIKPNHVVGQNTKSPSTTISKIVAANELGVVAKNGDSGANS